MSNQREKRIVLIHGAVNSSNFGDVLFVKQFYKMVTDQGDIPVFIEKGRFGISDFNKREIGYTNHPLNCKKADQLIYMSGGYFGDDDPSAYKSFKRWIRYFPIGLYFSLRRKDIYILGIGGAPLYSWYNRLSAKIIMNHSQKILVRDDDTARYFMDLGVKTPIRVTADTALSITENDLPPLDGKEKIEKFIRGRKTLLLHLPGTKELDERISQSIVPGLSRFLNENHETCLFLSYDFVNRTRIEDTLTYQKLKEFSPYLYDYSSAMQLCALIDRMNTIVTLKLHVGIIGCGLGKSVISIPAHQYKTKRFYEKIGESDRCVRLDRLTEDKVYQMLKKYADQPITVPEEIRRLSAENLKY